jgi:predicted ester cyclase
VSAEDPRALVRRYDEEILNRRNYDALSGLVSDGYIDHGAPPGSPPGPMSARFGVEAMVAGIPDLTVESDDFVVDGDRVAFRSTISGTHTGLLFGMPPTGKPVELTSVQLWRIADGKLAERWIGVDVMPLFAAANAWTPAGQAASPAGHE